MPNRARLLKQKLLNSIGLPFQKLLPASVIEQALDDEQVRYRESIYSPVVTLWLCLTQVLDSDGSLRNAVVRVMAWLNVAGVTIPCANTGAYCKARQRLPEAVIKRILKQSAVGLEAQVEPAQLWCGRTVKVLDGSSIVMSDTPANQKAYPQPSNQAEGCGFPIAQLVVVFSLTTGVVIEALCATLSTSEIVMARQLYHQLQPDDVLLADSAFGSYVDMALVQAVRADGVFRKQHARKTDFRRGKQLGIGDHIVTWSRPYKCPRAMSAPDFAHLPTTLSVREVHLLLYKKGFRPQEIILVTTLLDPIKYSKAKLAELYQLRWQAAEVNLNHVKTTLNMEMLAAKTPEGVRKQLWVHMLAYNLLRTLMWEAEHTHPSEQGALKLSLQGARQAFNQFIPLFANLTARCRRSLYSPLLQLVATQIIPLRPGRIEPRVRKRRPKAYPLMTQPRSTLKRKLAA
ncbi:MAG: IS4 family transposase [Cyanobacteria bacterium P01_H01_bin.152]